MIFFAAPSADDSDPPSAEAESSAELASPGDAEKCLTLAREAMRLDVAAALGAQATVDNYAALALLR
ncbi:MAG: hypothetical protein HYV96_12090 [Opitutae bacterium]|nr:hypothetical protein [Opitutae bacterium]